MVKITNNNFSVQRKYSKKDKEVLMEDKIKEFCSNVERIPEYGTFSSKQLKLKKYDKEFDVKDIVLTVKPSILLDERPKEREIEVSVKSYDELYTYSLVLARGENDEILQALKSDDLQDKINAFVKKAAEKFNDFD